MGPTMGSVESTMRTDGVMFEDMRKIGGTSGVIMVTASVRQVP